jgi:hypothetical protein
MAQVVDRGHPHQPLCTALCAMVACSMLPYDAPWRLGRWTHGFALLVLTPNAGAQARASARRLQRLVRDGDSDPLQVGRVVQPGDCPFSPAIHGQLGNAATIKVIGHSGEIGRLEPEPPVHHRHHGMAMRHDQHGIALDTSHHPLHPRHDSVCHPPPAFGLWIGYPVYEGFRDGHPAGAAVPPHCGQAATLHIPSDLVVDQ